MENLCSCRDSRLRGIICAHSLAVGLQVINARKTSASPGSPARLETEPRKQTDEEPSVQLVLEGSLRHLEAGIRFQYSRPNVANFAESPTLARLLRCGFAENKEKAVLRGEEAVIAFFATELPRLKKDWQVQEGERFQYVTRDLVRIEPQFAIREQSDGWLDFHVHTASQGGLFCRRP